MGDLQEPGRVWTIQSFYLPVPQRMLGGIRARVMDQKGFISFVNQRDLEVMMGLGEPDNWCSWLGSNYLNPADRDWCGPCVDSEDLLDDLYERELYLRLQHGQAPLRDLEIARRVHRDFRADEEELFVLLGDFDRAVGLCPDPRFETILQRWSRAERRRIVWQQV